jgi:pimeloyl-[acyl-carrier protein] methyl ester esterase
MALSRYHSPLMSGLFIETRGHGPHPLVVIHGWAMHGGVFAPLVEALSSQCTMYLVDLPGHGHSRDCGLTLEPAACARAIAAATPPAAWLGWSMGGLVALQAALDHPQRVLGLGMLCASPRFVSGPDWPHGVDAEVFRQFGRDLDADYRGTLDRFLALEAMGSDDAREDMRRLRRDVFARGEPDRRVLHEGLELLDRADLRARLPSLGVPSAWIAGHRDRLIPWQAMAWSAEACGGAFTRIARAGHAPFVGFAEAVSDALQPLFTSTPA